MIVGDWQLAIGFLLLARMVRIIKSSNRQIQKS
jgi:hypothetical protein